MAILHTLPSSCIILAAVVSLTYGALTTTTVDPLEELLLEMMRNNEEHQDPCDNLWCYNGGTCDSVGSAAWCMCMPGYTGPTCQDYMYVDSLPCVRVTCYNGGTCTRILDIEYCMCTHGYTGERCKSKSYDWGIPATVRPYLPDLNGMTEISFDLPTDNPVYPENWDYSDDSEYIDQSSISWIAPLTIVGFVALGALYGTVLHVVRHRRRRRLVLVRTVQVSVPETAARPMPQRLMAGLTPVPYPSRGHTRLLRCSPGVAVPTEFESDHTQLLPRGTTSNNDDPCIAGEDPTDLGITPVTTPSGAPPPYAEVAPADGGHSMDEPPPPYQDHVR